MAGMEHSITAEEMQRAAEQEEMERLNAENQRLATRVVQLRAVVNQLETRLGHQVAQSEDQVQGTTISGEGIDPTD